MANFWGAAAEGFNQGLAEAMRRAAEKRQMEYERQRTADERLWREKVAADERAYRDERDRILYDRENPIAAFMPGPQADPFAVLSNPGLLGQVMRRRDIEFQNEQELNAAKLESMRKGLAIPEGPTGSVLVPEGRFGSGYYEDPSNPGQVWVPGTQVSNATEQRGGGSDDIRYQPTIPLLAESLPPELQLAYKPRIKDGVIMVSPIESMGLAPYITPKAQAEKMPTAGEVLKYRDALWPTVSEDGTVFPGLVPVDVADKLKGTAEGAKFEAAYADAIKSNVGETAAVEAAYRSIDLPAMFPDIRLENGKVVYVLPGILRKDKSYGASEFQRFSKDVKIGDEAMKRALWDKLFGLVPADQTQAPTPAAQPGEDPEDAYLRAAGIKL